MLKLEKSKVTRRKFFLFEDCDFSFTGSLFMDVYTGLKTIKQT